MTAVVPGATPRNRTTLPLVEVKLDPPLPPPGTVVRAPLLRDLMDPKGPPVATLIAPPGYGKSTLLAQWAARETRPVAWLTLDSSDNDPAVLLAYLAAAFDRVQPLRPETRAVLRGATHRLLATAVPRLLSELHDWPSPGVVILDEVHVLAARTTLDIVGAFLDRPPPGARVALAGRYEPALPLARLRANRALLDLGPDRLALDVHETRALAAGAGHALEAGEANELALRTEGWAAGIYLSLLTRDHGTTVADRGSGGDHYIAAYLDSEVGRALGDEDLRFLARTSILEAVTPVIAEELTGLPRAAKRLASLARSNLLIQPVSRAASAYRYHKLLRDYLRGELALREPDAEPALHRQAADWFAAQGSLVPAVEHALAGGDRAQAARLATAAAVGTVYSGRAATVERWMDELGDGAMVAYPPLAVMAGWVHLLSGHAPGADRAADIAERSTFQGQPPDRSASFESARAMLLAMMCRNGPHDALANATLAAASEGPSSLWHCNAAWLKASCHWMLDDGADVEAILADAVTGTPAPAAGSAALAKHAALRIRAGDWDGAASLVHRARQRLLEVHYDGLLAGVMVYAVSARVAVHRGDLVGARDDLVHAQLVRPRATPAAPWFSVDALLELARAYLAVSDLGGARLALREAEAIVRRRPALGRLTAEVAAMRERLAGAATVLAGSSTLTAGELRVLPLLPTYLSFQEIADRLSISRNTVKTHAMSIYGKLWASSRGQAVERAVELGLLEPYPALAAGSTQPDQVPGAR